MLKAVGLVLVFTFSMVIGTRLSELEKKKRQACRELVTVIEYLSNEIPRRRMLNDIIADVCNRNKYLRASAKKELADAVKCVLTGSGTAEIVERTEAFLEGLGRGVDVLSERDACISFLEYMKPLCEALEAESTRRSEVYSRLGALCGLILCILVL